MTDTQAPERIWAKERYDSWGAYGHWYKDAAGGGHEFVNADIHNAVVAERNHANDVVNAAKEEIERLKARLKALEVHNG